MCDEDCSSDDSTDGFFDKEEYDFDKIVDVGLLKGLYKLDDTEELLFDGEYKWKFIKNKLLDVKKIDLADWNIPGQIAYSKGRVLYKSNIEDINIFDLIDLYARYTADPCSELELDTSIKETTQMRFGTICPTRKRLFVYKNREFIAYGRYIYGYDHKYVKIYNENAEFKLKNPPFQKDVEEYVYAFMIKNFNTQVVEAFGLYR